MSRKFVFEKSITRDWSLMLAQLFQRAYVSECPRQIKWNLSETVYEGVNRTVSAYRSLDELSTIKKRVKDAISGNPTWLARRARKVVKETEAIIAYISSLQKRGVARLNNLQLARALKYVFTLKLRTTPSSIVMLWFPYFMERDPSKRKYRRYINVAIETRSHFEKVGPIVDMFFRTVAGEALARAHLDTSLARYVSYEEAYDFLTKGRPFNALILSERKRYFIVTSEGVSSTPLQQYLKHKGFMLKRIVVRNVQKFNGTTAFPGWAKGNVCVLQGKEDFPRFEDNAILVAAMTTPDFLPVLKKCSAFITDEGGVTYHAAIIAREMRKPCIVGTKIATKVLKDGDMVEVDANEGIIRILQRA